MALAEALRLESGPGEEEAAQNQAKMQRVLPAARNLDGLPLG